MEIGIQYITTLTFDAPIPTGSANFTDRWSPWYRSSFSAADARVTQTAMADEDDEFGTMQKPHKDETQSLAEDTLLGNELIPAGTDIRYWTGSQMERLDENGEGTGEFFLMMFPVTQDSSYRMLGDGSTMFVFPMPTTNATTGETVMPRFDPDATYEFTKAVQASSANSATPYGWAPICFAAGTLIDCAGGPRRIETLVAGDQVTTRDRGLLPIRWIGSRQLTAADLDVNPAFRPLRIRAGALGGGLPVADLVVSPQHRVLVQSDLTERICGTGQVLVAAKHLTDIPGVEVLGKASGVTYWHMLFDAHELVRSNGVWTESLYTGPQAIKSLTAAARREILMLFPDLRDGGAGDPPAPARRLLTGREGRKIARHHARKGSALLDG
ncbi:Hint domain-containing protein [uncultured Paracoccus sp.]|uniref:Hint domain-containing protein n=1 Tax=uncultured Paracoccus sp. TaxID=189685 RepID=UPI002638CD47|nr:Hint domain-containing protein [uncultured Paracoccus sp.]